MVRVKVGLFTFYNISVCPTVLVRALISWLYLATTNWKFRHGSHFWIYPVDCFVTDFLRYFLLPVTFYLLLLHLYLSLLFTLKCYLFGALRDVLTYCIFLLLHLLYFLFTVLILYYLALTTLSFLILFVFLSFSAAYCSLLLLLSHFWLFYFYCERLFLTFFCWYDFSCTSILMSTIHLLVLLLLLRFFSFSLTQGYSLLFFNYFIVLYWLLEDSSNWLLLLYLLVSFCTLLTTCILL